ncbi:hypothetical protein D3C76_1637680 [compost metagenome]
MHFSLRSVANDNHPRYVHIIHFCAKHFGEESHRNDRGIMIQYCWGIRLHLHTIQRISMFGGIEGDNPVLFGVNRCLLFIIPCYGCPECLG